MVVKQQAGGRAGCVVSICACVPEVDECERENVDCGGPGVCVDGVNEVQPHPRPQSFLDLHMIAVALRVRGRMERRRPLPGVHK